MQAQQRAKDDGAFAAMVWFEHQRVTILSKIPGPRHGPDPLKILMVRRRDGAFASMVLPASIRPAFEGLERSLVLHHAGMLAAFVRSALSSLEFQPGDRMSKAAVTHGPSPAKLGMLRVFGGGIGYDLCEVDISVVPDARA